MLRRPGTPLRRSQAWLSLASAAAFAAGCAQTPPTAVVNQNAGAVATKAGQTFATYTKDGHLYCADCNTELNADGRHKVANLLINNLKALRTGAVLKMPAAKPGERNMAEHITVAMMRLGMEDIIKRHLQATPDSEALVNQIPEYVNGYPNAVQWVQTNNWYGNACCVPEGTPTPDGPY